MNLKEILFGGFAFGLVYWILLSIFGAMVLQTVGTNYDEFVLAFLTYAIAEGLGIVPIFVGVGRKILKG